MTLEEIKEKYKMADVLEMYGLQPNRSGFIRCPFHTGDRQASLKVYEKDFNCYACGANGDVIKFVQLMDGVDFKTAFKTLGGTYGKHDFSSRLAAYKAQKAREMKKKQQAELRRKQELNNMLISIYRRYMERSEPLSDVWCDCYNALQYQLYIHAEINGLEARW